MTTGAGSVKWFDSYDTPVWFITVVGLSLGASGLVYQLMHPEPVMVWLLEFGLVLGPAIAIVYGGHWIATNPLTREDRWVVATWMITGSVIGTTILVGYILTAVLSGATVPEPGQLVLLGAVGGPLVAQLTIISFQRRYAIPDAGCADEEDRRFADDPDDPLRTPARESRTLEKASKVPSKLLVKPIGIFRQGGASSLASSIYRYGSRRMADIGLVQRKPYHERKRTDSQQRWEMMAPHLQPDDATALDIGCASGFFTAKLADRGMLSIGVDIESERIESAIREWKIREGLGFALYEITPENVDTLPTVDVVLLLTVYHHWCDNFGSDSARDMLLELAKKSNRLFFEGPGRDGKRFPLIGDRPISDDESTEEFYSSWLRSIFDDRVEVTYLGEAPYPSSPTRTDDVFVIECREYD